MCLRADRVLHHSLPDVKDRLKCSSYYICDDLTDSDHRPVCAHYTLLTASTGAQFAPAQLGNSSSKGKGKKGDGNRKSRRW
jgi:hypothetical protein